TQADAKVLGAIVNATQGTGAFAGLTGGLGTYAPTETHGPFVHVDVRGFAARWGGWERAARRSACKRKRAARASPRRFFVGRRLALDLVDLAAADVDELVITLHD